MLERIGKKEAVKRWILALTVPALCLIFILAPTACTKHGGDRGNGTDVSEDPAVSQPAENPEPAAPEIAVVTPDELFDVIRKHKNKVVVVKFWATWCAPCVEEMPSVIDFYNKHKASEDVAPVSVSADLTDSIDDTLKPFLKDKNIPFPVWVIDAAGPDQIVRDLGLEESQWEGTLPASFLFDQQGRLDKFWIGPIPEGALDKAVNALLQ
jgi:thiol-disulfide isomerase/thioredoxin